MHLISMCTFAVVVTQIFSIKIHVKMKALNTVFINVAIIYQLLHNASCGWMVSWYRSLNFWHSIPAVNVSGSLACEDFYEYACQNYSQQNPDSSYNEITQQLDYQFNNKLLNYLNTLEEFNGTLAQTVENKLDLYYKSCIGETQRNMKKYLQEIQPSHDLNWPVFGEKVGKPWLDVNESLDMWPLLGQLHSYGLNNIVVYYQITRNEDDTLDIRLAPAWLDIEDLLPDPEIMQVLLQTLDIQEPQPIIQELNVTEGEWQELTEEYAAANETIQMKFQVLGNIYSHLNLSAYLENLLGDEIKNIASITLENPQYFEYLNETRWQAEDLEKLSNYLMMKFLFYLARDSVNDYTPLECVKDLRNKFDLAVNYVAYDSLSVTLSRFEGHIMNMFQNERHTIAKLFEENHLNLSREQLNLLEDKIQGIELNIGNIPKNFNHTIVAGYYRNLPNLDGSNYYKNHLFLLQHRFRKSLNYPQKQSHYIITDSAMGSESSPFYVAKQNMVAIPFGNLQLPIFHYNQTALEQLSLFGFILAHEQSHAFDTNGLNYDPQGFPSNSTTDIIEHRNFQSSLDCMREQEATEEIDERIADLFAIRVAYRTFSDVYAHKRENWQQKFFVNLAQFFCGKTGIDFIDHDSDQVRLRQILMNFAEFSKAFDCRRGTPMNPKTKCRLY